MRSPDTGNTTAAGAKRGARTRGAPIGLLLLALLTQTGCTAEMKARAYADEDRDEWQQPDRVVAELGIVSGQQLADLGSGGGYFTFRLASAVGPSGRVYAVDVDSEMNERLERLARERGAANVSVVLAAHDDPRLPEPVDLVFTSNTYHHIEDRVAYLERLTRYLSPGGRVAVVEYKRTGFLQRFLGHATEAEVIRDEFEQAGYTLEVEHDFLDRQSFLIFGRPARPAGR